MSRFLKNSQDTVLGLFTSLASPFSVKTVSAGIPAIKNYVPGQDRGRLARYAVNDALAYNYLDDYLELTGVVKPCYDEKGRKMPHYRGYGEAKKIINLLTSAIIGDSLDIKTKQKQMKDLWKELKLPSVFAQTISRSGELGDAGLHIQLDPDDKETTIVEYVDPASLFVFERSQTRIIHCAIAYIVGSGQYKGLLYVLTYRWVEGKVYFKEAYYTIEDDNKDDELFTNLKLVVNVTSGASPEPLIVQTAKGAVILDGYAILNNTGSPIDEIPIVLIPFIKVAGEDWGMSATQLIFDAVVDVSETNADLKRGAELAALPMLYKERNQYNTDGVIRHDAQTNEEIPLQVEPGILIDGKVSMVDNSNVLKAALEFRRSLLESAYENSNIPAFVYSPDRSKVVSGVALDISLYPLKVFVTQLRIQFETVFEQVCELIAKFNRFELGDMEIVWGTFANLSTSFMTAVGQVVSAGVLTPEQGEQILLQEGIITQEVVDLKPKGVTDDRGRDQGIAREDGGTGEEDFGIRSRAQDRARQGNGGGSGGAEE